MAIKRGLNPRLAEIGKIKIGGKGDERTSKKDGKEKKWRLPVKWDHFKVTTTERDASGNFVMDPDVMGEGGVGDKPKELSIRLPFDDIDMNFFTSYQFYVGAKLKCKGDGEKAARRDKDGNETEVACDPEKCEFILPDSKGATKCKVSGILSCYLVASPSYGGVYRFRTHSWNSVSNILAALEEFARNTGGILQGLPLKLKMLKKATEDHGNVNTVTIVLDGIELREMQELAYEEKENRKRLDYDPVTVEAEIKESGFDPDTDDPEEVEAEYYADGEPDDDDPEAGVSAEDVTEAMTDQNPQPSEDKEKAEVPEEKTGKDLF